VTRLAYLGTPALSVRPLRALVDAGFEVVAVVTRADKRRGRGADLVPSPVKAAALELGIPVHHRVDDLLEVHREHPIELGVVVAFGQLIRPNVLDVIPMVNMHFSLLPRWRGAAPVERAFLAGDEVTGVCLMRVEEGLDTGAVYARRELPIRTGETADELRDELVEVGTELLVRGLTDGLGEPEPQVGEPTYAEKMRPEELHIDWSAGPVAIDRLVRLGGAWTVLRGKRLKVLQVEIADDRTAADTSAGSTGALTSAASTAALTSVGTAVDELVGDVVGGVQLLRVQPEGKPPMSFADFARGARLAPGEPLGR
jgi:methionyl-tRNA formyltransferase